jgi:hypothetical protein
MFALQKFSMIRFPSSSSRSERRTDVGASSSKGQTSIGVHMCPVRCAAGWIFQVHVVVQCACNCTESTRNIVLHRLPSNRVLYFTRVVYLGTELRLVLDGQTVVGPPVHTASTAASLRDQPAAVREQPRCPAELCCILRQCLHPVCLIL